MSHLHVNPPLFTKMVSIVLIFKTKTKMVMLIEGLHKLLKRSETI